MPGSKDPDPLHQLVPVPDLARFFKQLKSDPRAVYVAVIAAPPAPVTVETMAPSSQNPTLGVHGCSTGGMEPGIRLAAFAASFDPDRGRFFSCDQNYGASMDQIGTDLAAMLGQ